MRLRAALVVAAVNAFASIIFAQSPSGRPTFDAASIKLDTSGNIERAGGFQPGGRFHGINMTVRMLIAQAYGQAGAMSADQLIGGPKWIDVDGFDVEATPSTTVSPEQRALMLRTLLSDRFGLVMHTEQRDAPVYALGLARSDKKLGPRLSPAKTECVNGATAPLPLDPKKRYCGALTADRGGHFFGMSATMTQLASVMSRRLGRPVVNQTQLEGTYDLEIDYVPGQNATADPSDGVSIFTAFQEQLGLKLQPATRPVDVLIIDHIERPTED